LQRTVTDPQRIRDDLGTGLYRGDNWFHFGDRRRDPAFSRRPTAFAAKNEKRKGLQLALEPLNGQGIAGYVPEP
jgi:hypothetical protein